MFKTYFNCSAVVKGMYNRCGGIIRYGICFFRNTVILCKYLNFMYTVLEDLFLIKENPKGSRQFYFFVSSKRAFKQPQSFVQNLGLLKLRSLSFASKDNNEYFEMRKYLKKVDHLQVLKKIK